MESRLDFKKNWRQFVNKTCLDLHLLVQIVLTAIQTFWNLDYLTHGVRSIRVLTDTQTVGGVALTVGANPYWRSTGNAKPEH